MAHDNSYHSSNNINNTIQVFQVTLPSSLHCHRRHHNSIAQVHLFVTCPLNPISSHCYRIWLHLSIAVMIPIQLRPTTVMCRYWLNQRHRIRVAKRRHGHAINSIVSATDICRLNGHRPMSTQHSMVTETVSYRLRAMPIDNWPLLNTLNRVAVGITLHPNPARPMSMPHLSSLPSSVTANQIKFATLLLTQFEYMPAHYPLCAETMRHSLKCSLFIHYFSHAKGNQKIN